MRNLAIGLGLTLLVFACTSGDDGGTPVKMDAPAAGAFGTACVTVTDTGSTECTSGVCTNAFDMIGHPVCSQKCPANDGSTCPAGADGTMKCNMKGYCKP
jgi:hypothetical protein